MLLYSFITQLLTFTLASGTLLWNWALTPLSTTDFGDSVGYKPSKLTSKTKLRSNNAALNPPETVRSFFTTVVDGSDLAGAGFWGWVGGGRTRRRAICLEGASEGGMNDRKKRKKEERKRRGRREEGR